MKMPTKKDLLADIVCLKDEIDDYKRCLAQNRKVYDQLNEERLGVLKDIEEHELSIKDAFKEIDRLVDQYPDMPEDKI